MAFFMEKSESDADVFLLVNGKYGTSFKLAPATGRYHLTLNFACAVATCSIDS